MSQSMRHEADAGIRSVADVLALVDTKGIQDENYLVRFYAKSYTLPDGKKTGIVAARAEGQTTDDRFTIRIPTCFGFQASLLDGTSLSVAPIEDLNGSVASPDGLVRLAPTKRRPNELLVKNVRFLPAAFDCSFAGIERAVVRYAITYLRMDEYCYREIDPEHLPGLKGLDYGLVSDIRIDSPKRLLKYIEDRLLSDLTSNSISPDIRKDLEAWEAGGSLRNAIAKTLKRSGLQRLRT